MSEIKTGDLIKCIDNYGYTGLTAGKVYKVFKVDGDVVYIERDDGLLFIVKPSDCIKVATFDTSGCHTFTTEAKSTILTNEQHEKIMEIAAGKPVIMNVLINNDAIRDGFIGIDYSDKPTTIINAMKTAFLTPTNRITK